MWKLFCVIVMWVNGCIGIKYYVYVCFYCMVKVIVLFFRYLVFFIEVFFCNFILFIKGKSVFSVVNIYWELSVVFFGKFNGFVINKVNVFNIVYIGNNGCFNIIGIMCMSSNG